MDPKPTQNALQKYMAKRNKRGPSTPKAIVTQYRKHC